MTARRDTTAARTSRPHAPGVSRADARRGFASRRGRAGCHVPARPTPRARAALFDFEYLRRPSACDARLSRHPALRRGTKTCRAACQSRVWRAYRSFANVVRWRDAFVAFCESLRERDVAGESSSEDAGRADRSYDSDTRHDVTDDDTDDTDDGSFANAETPRTNPRPRRRSRRNDERKSRGRTPSFRAASRDRRFPRSDA